MLIWSRVVWSQRPWSFNLYWCSLYSGSSHMLCLKHCTITMKAQHFQFQVLSYLSNSTRKTKVLLSDVSEGMLVPPFLLYKDRHHSLLSDMWVVIKSEVRESKTSLWKSFPRFSYSWLHIREKATACVVGWCQILWTFQSHI